MIEFQNLTLGYDRHPAVHHLTGRIEAGSLVAVVGPNGAGKSTLLKAIIGEIVPIGGHLRLEAARRRDVAYLPQVAEIDRSFPITVYDFVAMGLWKRVGIFGGLGRGHAARIHEAIAAVGLSGFDARTIGTLSGGQMQRMLFARLLLQDARVILLDEPFNAIDSRTVSDLMALVSAWHGEGRTVVAVLHDLDLVRTAFPQTLLIAREMIHWGATPECLTDANLAEARRMIEAFDTHAAACARDAA